MEQENSGPHAWKRPGEAACMSLPGPLNKGPTSFRAPGPRLPLPAPPGPPVPRMTPPKSPSAPAWPSDAQADEQLPHECSSLEQPGRRLGPRGGRGRCSFHVTSRATRWTPPRLRVWASVHTCAAHTGLPQPLPQTRPSSSQMGRRREGRGAPECSSQVADGRAEAEDMKQAPYGPTW